jgi:hypothetical protein
MVHRHLKYGGAGMRSAYSDLRDGLGLTTGIYRCKTEHGSIFRLQVVTWPTHEAPSGCISANRRLAAIRPAWGKRGT